MSGHACFVFVSNPSPRLMIRPCGNLSVWIKVVRSFALMNSGWTTRNLNLDSNSRKLRTQAGLPTAERPQPAPGSNPVRSVISSFTGSRSLQLICRMRSGRAPSTRCFKNCRCGSGSIVRLMELRTLISTVCRRNRAASKPCGRRMAINGRSTSHPSAESSRAC